ncbi:hypothetical protein, unlikely [Trypanosoma brucei gambiense DAL972]|uniref:Uncharacterized protein n=1 Tax=Trypanosoma brucei gambiense (strain MHOM/CI/86/DAL972) TaxID=679716 RepID=D0A921_TRYB9|nr:hypothetical protein, unlikely [Trypanosoma brucei gambiense DAL972]CBH18172.1 hypothetical protein, unlikely [Trypanosoma brucei gambiense DAL972]|eukprot:XP_011780436.1 hypothetical protein, unlikely [Trypanosoma brucei gambiense DAL972]
MWGKKNFLLVDAYRMLIAHRWKSQGRWGGASRVTSTASRFLVYTLVNTLSVLFPPESAPVSTVVTAICRLLFLISCDYWCFQPGATSLLIFFFARRLFSRGEG